MARSEHKYWVGVDWGHEAHAVCVVDRDGEVVARFRQSHSVAGLAALVERLGEYRAVGGVAIEATRHVVVQALLEAGFTVYTINPNTSHGWCKAASVAGAKDDARDAWVLADGLRHYHAQLQPLRPDAPSSRELALVCEDERRLIGKQTALVQQLRDVLRQYFPAALEWFKDWTCAASWDFILAFPTAEALAGASPRKLYGFFKRHRMGLTAARQALVAGREQATAWPSDPAVVAAKSVLAVALAKQLRALAPTLRAYRVRIDSQYVKHEDRALYASLPGAGEKLAPRLAAAFGTDRTHFDSAHSVQQLSGTAPVTRQSGHSRHVHIRYACRKGLRTTLHLFAWQSTRSSEWARAYYDLARRRGQSHALALRNLANKWVKIIYRMWQDRQPYDEARYLRQMVRTRSPVAYELGLLKTGG